MTEAPPHDGEVHLDGDEVLFPNAGKITVVLEDADPFRKISMRPGDSLIVPKHVWHKVLLDQPSQLLHLPPGPNSDYRPLQLLAQDSRQT